MARITKNKMLREMVRVCMRWLKIGAVWGMGSQTAALLLDRVFDPAPTLVFLGTAFGGELLMCLVKRIFAKKDEEETV